MGIVATKKDSNNISEYLRFTGLLFSDSCSRSAPHTPDETPAKSQSIDLVEVLRASARERSLIFPLSVSVSNNESKNGKKELIAETQRHVCHVSTIESTTGPEPEPTMAYSGASIDVCIPTVSIESVEYGIRGEETTKSKKIPKSKKKQGNFRSESSGSNESACITLTATTSDDTSSPTLTDTTDYKSATTSFSEASSRTHSFTSAQSAASLSTTKESSIDENSQSTPTLVTKHSKTGSNSSSGSFSTPKPPSSRNRYPSKTIRIQRTASDPQNNTSRTAGMATSSFNDNRSDCENMKLTPRKTSSFSHVGGSEATVASLQNSEEWPALESIKTTCSKVADGKPPIVASLPSIAGHSASGSKNSNAVIPVLPLNMIPRRHNS